MKNRHDLHVQDWEIETGKPATIEDIMNSKGGPPGLFDDDENDERIEQPNDQELL
jgi:hypothetical protein